MFWFYCLVIWLYLISIEINDKLSLPSKVLISVVTPFSSEASESALVGHLSRHKGPVSSLLCSILAYYLWWSFQNLGGLIVTGYEYFFLFFEHQVRGLEFNVIAPNLLASGADDGEICIWDLANPAEPSQFPPLKVCCYDQRTSKFFLF